MTDVPVIEDRHCDVLYCVYKGNVRCEQCKNVYYCSPICQKEDWKMHKYYCKHEDREKVVDGYRVCDTILKCNDYVHTYLAGKVFDKIEVSHPEHVVESVGSLGKEEIVTIYSKPNKEGDIFKPVEAAMIYLQDGLDLDGLKAYWALRSISSSFSLNDALLISLKKYRDAGYTTLLFGKLEIPLDDSLKLDLVSIVPKIGVVVDDPVRKQPTSKTTMTPFLSLGEFSISLATGAYWYFDFNNRPLLVAPHEQFVEYLGKLVDADTEKTHHASTHKKRMFRNQDVSTRTATILYIAMHQFCLEDGRDLSPYPHLAKAPIQTQRDKLYAAKMMDHPKFEKTMERFIEKGGTPTTEALKTMDTEYKEEVAKFASAIDNVENQ